MLVQAFKTQKAQVPEPPESKLEKSLLTTGEVFPVHKATLEKYSTNLNFGLETMSHRG